MEIKINHVKIGSGKPKVCVPIVGGDEESILEVAHEIVRSECDLVEWRADWYENIFDADSTIQVLERLRGILDITPIIFTVRTKSEGGQIDISFDQYSDLLLEVAQSRLVELIDVEVFKDPGTSELIEKIKDEDVCVIGSNHDFIRTEPVEVLCDKISAIADAGADIPKLAVMPQSKDDVVNLLIATHTMNSKLETPIVTMSMGKLGAISRVSGETFGSAITFGSVRKASAPGQIEVNILKRIMEQI